MHISEVRIKLRDDSQERLQAFCSITIDGCFVVRDLKIINGTKGPFVAMPSRKLTDRCPRCTAKNCLRAVFCSQCGTKLTEDRAVKSQDGRSKLYADIAHPINTQCREMIQDRVLAAFAQEQVLAEQPGYVCRYDEIGDDSEYDSREEWEPATKREASPATSVATSPEGGRRRFESAAESPEGPHPPSRGRIPQQAAHLRQAMRTESPAEAFGEGII